jgi:hypothetical protein
MTRDMEPTYHAALGSVTVLAERAPEAVLHLRSAVRSGVPWYQAMLEAIGLWTLPQEVHQGRVYQYLILGEAFDWLLLVERLCPELDGAISDEEREALLFNGKLPEDVTPEMFQELIGGTKHRGYLNYWYGVVMEEALQLATEEEVRKRHRARCYPDSEELVEEAFIHLYGKTRADLLEEFRQEAKKNPLCSFGENEAEGFDLNLTDLKEFTYWLFKRRVKMWDPARVASDTRKGIRRLHLLEEGDAMNQGYGYQPPDCSHDVHHLRSGAIDVGGRTFG